MIRLSVFILAVLAARISIRLLAYAPGLFQRGPSRGQEALRRSLEVVIDAVNGDAWRWSAKAPICSTNLPCLWGFGGRLR